jgi:hypothetical protein
MHNVSGHRETNNTACPGEKVMALLDEMQSEIHSGLANTSRTGFTLTNRAPGGRETRVNTPLTYEWTAETPEPGGTLAGYEYCFEGWYKPSSGINVTYLSGYTAQTQPRPVYTRVDPNTRSKTFTPKGVGQYTLHVRAILKNGATDAERRSAYEGRHTYLVK